MMERIGKHYKLFSMNVNGAKYYFIGNITIGGVQYIFKSREGAIKLFEQLERNFETR